MNRTELLKKAFDQSKDGIKAIAKTITGEGTDAEKVEAAGKLLVKTVEDLETTAKELAEAPAEEKKEGEGQEAPAGEAPAEGGEGGEGGEAEPTEITKKVADLEKTVTEIKKYADMYVSANDLAELLKQLKEGVTAMNNTATAMVKSHEEIQKTLSNTVVSKQLHKTEEASGGSTVFGAILG